MRIWYRWISLLLFALFLAVTVTVAGELGTGWQTNVALVGLMTWFLADRYVSLYVGRIEEHRRVASGARELFDEDPALKASLDQAIASHHRRHEQDQSGHDEHDDLARWRR